MNNRYVTTIFNYLHACSHFAPYQAVAMLLQRFAPSAYFTGVAGLGKGPACKDRERICARLIYIYIFYIYILYIAVPYIGFAASSYSSPRHWKVWTGTSFVFTCWEDESNLKLRLSTIYIHVPFYCNVLLPSWCLAESQNVVSEAGFSKLLSSRFVAVLLSTVEIQISSFTHWWWWWKLPMIVMMNHITCISMLL